MKETILKCDNISKKIGSKEIINNISFEIKEGEIVALIGPNGSGKTTTMKLILGLQKLTKGSIIINDHNIEKEFEQAIKEVGALIETPDHYTNLTGYQNIKLASNLYKNITKSQIEETIQITGLTTCIHKKVKKYSLGMRQRLGIALALLHKPKLLILDEPTNGLDPKGIKELRELILNLASKEKMAIVISSHNLSELENFCTRTLIINRGKIVSEINNKNSSKSKYRIELDRIPKIKKYSISVTSKNIIECYMSKTEINTFIKYLIKRKIKIYEVKKLETNLEEIFFERVGDNND